jgi:hypothetical protein
MLQVVDQRTQRLLQLADHIEDLDDDEFNMRDWCKCIAGHCVKYYGPPERAFMASQEPRIMYEAADILGLNEREMIELFTPGLVSDGDLPTPKEAAQTLRELAVSGQISWAEGKRGIVAYLRSRLGI